MTAVRQDAWTQDEDVLLAETVLRHIREGSTQLTAFEEVGKKLSRTPAACGFRWNSFVRKQYESAIVLAKKQRKEINKEKRKHSKVRKERVEKPVLETSGRKANELDLSSVIQYLNGLKNETPDADEFKRQNDQLSRNLDEIRKEKKALAEELRQLQLRYETIKNDYQSLMSIMDRARELAGEPNKDRSTVPVSDELQAHALKVEK